MPLVDSSLASIRLLDLATDLMCQRQLGEVIGEMRCLADPIAEGGAEAMRGDLIMPHSPKQLDEGVTRERFAGDVIRENEFTRRDRAADVGRDLPDPFEDREGWLRERDDVLLAALHPRRRDDPFPLGEIDLTPCRAPRLTAPGAGQDGELERERDDAFALPEVGHECPDRLMIER